MMIRLGTPISHANHPFSIFASCGPPLRFEKGESRARV
jgi:hypothetical protein